MSTPMSLRELSASTSRRAARQTAHGLLWTVLGLFSSGAWPLPSWAHSLLLETEPEDGSVLQTSPAQVIIWFSEELESGPSRLEVRGSDAGKIIGVIGGVDLHDPEHRRLQAVLSTALPPGRYIVRWTAVSAEDGHHTEGAFQFDIRAAAGSAVD